MLAMLLGVTEQAVNAETRIALTKFRAALAKVSLGRDELCERLIRNVGIGGKAHLVSCVPAILVLRLFRTSADVHEISEYLIAKLAILYDPSCPLA